MHEHELNRYINDVVNIPTTPTINKLSYYSNIAKIHTKYIKFILDNGPYAYHISLTFTTEHSVKYITGQINILIKMLSKKIWTSVNGILIEGFVFIESSSLSSKCSHHCHIIIKDHSKLNLKKSFEQLLFENISKVRAKRNNELVDKPEFDMNCVRIVPIRNQDYLIGYLTKEFWRDKDGNFIKIISAHPETPDFGQSVL